MVDDDSGCRPTSSSKRRSAFSLAEFADLVSAALDINSDRIPDGALRLTFDPESESSSCCPFISNNNAHCNYTRLPSLTSGATSARHQRHQKHVRRDQQSRCMHPPVESIDFGRVGLGCAPCGSPGLEKSSSVPIITVTTPPSPSRSRLVLQKIRNGASAFVARTRTLSSPAKHTPTSIQTLKTALKSHTAPTSAFLNPNNPNYEPIPTVSISTSYKNNIHLRSAVSLLDLECFNNDSAYSLATNTADFYDDESDFVPYLPLACQYERAFPKSPSMPSLAKSAPAASMVTIVDPPKNASKIGIGMYGRASRPNSGGGNLAGRNRCISTGHIQQRGRRLEGRNRALSSASSVTSSTTDTTSPVTPRSNAFLGSLRTVHDGQVRPSSAFSLDSMGESDGLGDEMADSLGINRMQGLGLSDSDDPFAKGSVQVVRTQSRAKPAFHLYNPTFVVGPDSAKSGDPIILSGSESGKSNNKSIDSSSPNIARKLHMHDTVVEGSTLSTPALVQQKSRSTLGSKQSKRSLGPSVSPTPISRMKKQPVVFPLMPGETEAQRRRQEEAEEMPEGDEWTLCLGTSAVTRQSDNEMPRESSETVPEMPGDVSQEEERPPKSRKVKICEELPVVDGERGRNSTARKKSVPQLRVMHFDGREKTEDASKSGPIGGLDWTLMLPLYQLPPDPILAKGERPNRRASHSPPPILHTLRPEVGDEERRRAISCTSMTPTLTVSIVKSKPSIDQLTIRASSHSQPSPASSSPIDPLPGQRADAERLTPPTTSFSQSSLSVISSGPRVTYGSNGSAECRASVVSVASLASGTTSSTATVVPGPWQREQMHQGPQSRSSQILEDEAQASTDGNDRQRRQSTFSITTLSPVSQTTEFVIAETPGGGVRKTTVVNRMPLPMGREAEIRARTVSIGGLRRCSVPSPIAGTAATTPSWSIRGGGLASLFSARSREREKGKGRPIGGNEKEEQVQQETERGRTRAKKKDLVHSDKDGDGLVRRMPGQWLTVSGREGSLRSMSSHDSIDLGRRKEKRDSMCSIASAGILDDGASSYSGTYYSARSSFSISGHGPLTATTETKTVAFLTPSRCTSGHKETRNR